MRLVVVINVLPKALQVFSLPSAMAAQIERSETPTAAAASRALYVSLSVTILTKGVRLASLPHLFQPHTWPLAVFLNENHAGRFEGGADGGEIVHARGASPFLEIADRTFAQI